MTTKTSPGTCNICNAPIVNAFVDGRTVMGPWADMCLACHKRYGKGLGTGNGQKYTLQPSGQFVKTE